MNPDLKAEVVRAWSAYEYVRTDPMASSQQVEAAREKFLDLAAKLKVPFGAEPEAKQ